MLSGCTSFSYVLLRLKVYLANTTAAPVVKATFEAPLRHNSVETFDEYNTGKNVGKGTPTVFWDIVPDSDQCEIYAYMAGGGCTLPGKAMVLMPGAGYEGVTRFVMDVMTSYGLERMSSVA